MEKKRLCAFVLIILLVISVQVVAQNQGISDKIKNFLIKQTDRVVHYIEDMKLRIIESNYFTPEEKDGIESNLDSYIEYFENKKQEINSSESIAEIRIIVRDLKEKWTKLEKYRNSLRGLIYVLKFEDIVKKSKKPIREN